MRLRPDCICFVFALVALGLLLQRSSAQDREPANAGYASLSRNNAKSPASRLLTADEGLAVLGAALESRARNEAESDCSHLVHAIYERAGFPYRYAPSSSLYAGAEQEFQRVTRPQPGDLVVWPGHSGIVVNPAQHTFFSALRSGHGVEAYDSAYWNDRGHARFFRYVTEAGVDQASSPSENASLKTAASSSLQPASRNASWRSNDEPQTPFDSPRGIVSTAIIPSTRPAVIDVTAAVEQALNASADSFRGTDLLNPAKPVIVFDHLLAMRVRIGRDRGWAEIRLTGALKLSKQKVYSTKHDESLRLPLVRRDHDSWKISLPSDVVYIPSDLAVRTLARQLSVLADEPSVAPGMADEKIRLSRLLTLSLEKPRTTQP